MKTRKEEKKGGNNKTENRRVEMLPTTLELK